MIYEKDKAFTLIELLVVVSVISLLLAILMPALSAAKSGTHAIVCKSNIRQLLLASTGYANEHDGFNVPAASDMWDSPGLHRWHGSRNTLDEKFDATKGPLVNYLSDGRIKECPAKKDFLNEQDWNTNFEQGCGGYGYNMTYIGSRLWRSGICSTQNWKDAYTRTTRMTEISAPGETLMFADTGMAKDENFLIEYSFAEPPFTVYNGQPVTSFYMSPSIHFRHRDYANIGWADGHTGQSGLSNSDSKNTYGINSANMKLGWFEPVNNALFDLE
jgi:prepilin-type N-terminal cleavage/methylation domain-containing protein/prepilin-type processing-associated H-X9-DG protein